ncbi:MAG: DUF58 domain-containing protein [Planctomycetota bacterium]|jgi:uncharacterized protein (DUF58 family)
MTRGWRLWWGLTAAWFVAWLLTGSWAMLAIGAFSASAGFAVLAYQRASRIGWLQGWFIRRTVRITRVGGIYILLVVAMAFAAVNTGANLLYLVFAMLLAMLLVSGFLSESGLRRLGVIAVAPPAAEAGTVVAVPVRLENRKRFSVSYALRIEPRKQPGLEIVSGGYAPKVGAQRTAEARVRVRFARRGRHALNHVRVSTGFPFGFVRHAWWHATDVTCIVLPRIGRLHRLPAASPAGPLSHATHARGAGEDEFHALREYRPGDNPRRIHWRSSARLGRLLVREQRAERRGVAVVLVTGAFAPADGAAALDDVADLAATVVHGLHHGGWVVHVALAGAPARYQLVREPRGVEGVRLSLVEWAGGPEGSAAAALPHGAAGGAACLVLAPDGWDAAADVAGLRGKGAVSLETWHPEDALAGGWVDFPRKV